MAEVFRNMSTVYIRNMPKSWKIEHFIKAFSQMGTIESVDIIKDSIGLPTGRAMVRYLSEESAQSLYERQSKIIFDGCIPRVLLYSDKKPNKKTAHLTLTNVPYDCIEKEIINLIKPFAAIEKVLIPRGGDYRPKGIAFVWLTNPEYSSYVLKYAEGRHIKNRPVHISLTEYNITPQKK